MKKAILLITLNILAVSAAMAIDEGSKSAGAAQTAQLALSDGIDISYISSGSANGGDAIMNFANSADCKNGVESATQQLRVRSNKTFKVAVRYEESSFVYEGSSNQKPAQMPSDMLWMKVNSNNTGGNLQAPFSSSSYAAVTTADKVMLTDGQRGGNQTFSVQYKCVPGFNLPAGTYNMDVVFTATQE